MAMQNTLLGSRAPQLTSSSSLKVRRHTCHQRLHTAAKASLNQIFNPVPAYRRIAADLAGAEIYEAVRKGSSDFQRVSALVDTLLESNLPFKEKLLGGGPWQVVYTRGPLLWQGFTVAGNALSKHRIGRSKNKASQEYNPADRSVINRGEVLGDCVRVSACGSYEPVGETKTMPVLVKADIEGGELNAFGRSLPLPIRGSGYVSIAYLDECLRVLQDRRGGVAVQMREDVLQQLLAANG
ncbi:g3337 [Coccomyxa elongata]